MCYIINIIGKCFGSKSKANIVSLANNKTVRLSVCEHALSFGNAQFVKANRNKHLINIT